MRRHRRTPLPIAVAHSCGQPWSPLRPLESTAVGGVEHPALATTEESRTFPMTVSRPTSSATGALPRNLLLTHHHRQAMENACERGFWMPLALSAEQAADLTYLVAVSSGAAAITAIAEITSLEPWRQADGTERHLPFLGALVPLLRPVPLGDHQLLAGWLPRTREQLQLLSLGELLQAGRLSDLLAGSGACCLLSPVAAAADGCADRAA